MQAAMCTLPWVPLVWTYLDGANVPRIDFYGRPVQLRCLVQLPRARLQPSQSV